MLRSLIFLIFSFSAVTALVAQTTPFTKVADTTTPIPDGTGNFVDLSGVVSVDSAGRVAFHEAGSVSDAGIYLSKDGTITRAVDVASPIPEGSGVFEFFSFFGNGIDDGIVAFRGNGSGGQAGVYAYDHDGGPGGSGLLSLIANTSTAIPNGTGNFTSFTTAYVDGSDFAFIASGDEQQGIYISDGLSLTRIADKTTVVPGIGGFYGWSSQLGFDGGALAFWSNVTGGSAPGNIIGAFTPGGGLVTLATTATTVPGTSEVYTSFSSPADLSGSTVAFRGGYDGGSGVFTVDLAGGAITTIATTPTAAPGGGGNFSNFAPPSIAGEVVAFQASTSSGVTGIYLHDGSRLRKVISTADRLDGKLISSLAISENSLAGGFLGFRASFSDSSIGIYLLTISELVDAPTVDPAKLAALRKAALRKIALRKDIKRFSKLLTKARKAGQRGKVKRFSGKLRKLRRELRQL